MENKLLKTIKNVDGFLRDDEASLLCDLARRAAGNGVIVEIGSWKGKSTICLASGSKRGEGSLVYAIDPHTGSPEHKKKFGKVDTFSEFNNNLKMAGVQQIVKPLRKTSHEASRNFTHPIKLLFIDGDHSYKSVREDFRDWSPKLIDGGTIAFHDTISWPGPKKLVLEEIYSSNIYKNIKLLGSITYAQKTNDQTLLDKSGNLYSLVVRHLRNLIADLPLPTSLRLFAKRALNAIQ